MQLVGVAQARARRKYHDWVGRMSGSRAGGSALSQEARDEKQRALVGEGELILCFCFTQKPARERMQELNECEMVQRRLLDEATREGR